MSKPAPFGRKALLAPATRANSEAKSSQSLGARELQSILADLHRANARVGKLYPGEAGDRQPVHTFYGGAQLFKSDTAVRLGVLARAALDEFAPNGATLARVLDLGAGASNPAAFANTVRARIVDKLTREPIEDYRIDFEDGYGNRPDAEEDGHAESAAFEAAQAWRSKTLPEYFGIRIKPLSKELHPRSLRTLDIFVTTLAKAGSKRLPPHFCVTIPKVMTPVHVQTVARVCAALERRLGLPSGTIKLEVMIETPQSVVSADGTSVLRALVAAGAGRVRGAHFGTYDYTALLGITASWQHMRHPACDFARHMMQVSLAQSGVQLSDGGTNVMPVPVHRAAEGGVLTPDQQRENNAAMQRAWKIHFDAVRHSLMNGYYQGWDLHPAQLPTRYAAVFSFFQSARQAATARLRAFVEKAAQATLLGDVFDDAATGQGLLNFFVRGVSSGALTMEEAAETGLTRDELLGRSFLRIVEARTKGPR
jgi:citrate lyase beta subunit